MKVVMDTNVLVSALINPFGTPARVLDIVLAGGVRWVYDDRILAEYREVLTRESFGFPAQAVADLIGFLKAEGEHVIAPPLPAILPDRDDAPFLEVAVVGNAMRVPVLAPADFLARYSPSER